jgi:short-subunit dehydrogenase
VARVALVAGAGGGIGRAVARALAAQGRDLALLGRDRSALEATAADVGRRVRSRVVVADAAERGQVEMALREVTTALGPVTVLVNAVGVADSAPLLPPDDAIWERALRANATAAWVLSTAVLPAMLDAGFGRIVHVASSASKRAFRYTAAYVASKHAVLGLVRALAADLEGSGVTVHAVCPGFVDTPMTDRSLERIEAATGRDRDAALAALLRSGGQERLLSAEEVADAVAGLCREEVSIPSGGAVDLT